MSFKRLGLMLIGAAALAACGQDGASNGGVSEVVEPDNADILAAAMAGEHRGDEERARDQYRHPAETLQFFEIEPDMKVVEIWPGAAGIRKL